MLHVLRANQLPVEKSKDECKKLEVRIFFRNRENFNFIFP